MELAIKVSCLHDDDLGKAGFVFELNLMDGETVLDQKNIQSLDKTFYSDDLTYSKEVFTKELRNYIEYINEIYDTNKIEIIIGGENHLLKKDLDFDNIDIDFKSFDKKQNINYELHKNVLESFNHYIPNLDIEFKEKIEPIKEIQKNNTSIAPKKNKKKNKSNKNQSIESFIEEKNKNENLFNKVFDEKTNDIDSDEVHIDYNLVINRDRKRVGVVVNYYKTKKDLMNALNPIHRTENIIHGEINIGLVHIKKELNDKINKLLSNDKKISLNISKSGMLGNDRIQKSMDLFLKKENLLNKIEITNYNTSLYRTRVHVLRSKINKDIDIYLKELKNPNTVAIFTDGSVNVKRGISGSGVLIRHQLTNELLSETNVNIPDSTYSEFKAIHMGLTKVANSKHNYKDKKIIIISDNDLMSHSISERLSGNNEEKDRPFLSDICKIIKENKLDIYFHNVKSHIHEKIEFDKEEELYDFKYNNMVDLIAKSAAGFSLTTENIIELSHDTKYTKKIKVENEPQKIKRPAMFTSRKRMS